MAELPTDAAGASSANFALAEVLDAGGQRAGELTDQLCSHSFAIIELLPTDAATLGKSLDVMSMRLAPLHHSAPLVRRASASSQHEPCIRTSSQTRRVLMSFLPNRSEHVALDSDDSDSDGTDSKDGGSDGESNASDAALSEVAEAAHDIHPMLLHVARVATAALAAARASALHGVPLNDGKFDAFWYPSDGATGRAFQDKECPCVAHTDPGIVTIVAETTAALEVQSANDGKWRRLALGPHQLAVLTGKQLELISQGAFVACTHRVAPTAAPRASYVLEVARRVEEQPLDPRERVGQRLWDPRGGFTR